MKTPILLAICLLLFTGSCKEEEEPTPYTSFASQVLEKWKVVSSTNNSNSSTQTYPNSIEASSFTFKGNGQMEYKVVCNNGVAGRYLVSETGGILIDDRNGTGAICKPITLSQDWTIRMINTLDNAHHVSIDGSTMKLSGSDDFSLTLEKE